MPKLDGLKEKLSAFQAMLGEKADKIAFIKAWRSKSASDGKRSAAGSPYGLGTIYREGSTFTRLQVLLLVAFMGIAVVSASSLAKKFALKLRSSGEHEKMKQEYSHGLAEMQRKVLEKAEMLSLGQFTTNAYVGPPRETAMMQVDLWIRVSDPTAASLVNNKTAIFHDKTMDALNGLFVEKVSLLTDAGKNLARARIRQALGQALPKGHSVEEVFIQNLVVQ